MIKSINPFNGNEIASYEEFTPQRLASKLASSDQAYNSWKGTAFPHKAKSLKKLAVLLTGKKDELATLITSEMGKIFKESKAEIEKCAWLCKHYADNSEAYLTEDIIETDASKSFVKYEPLGVIYGIMPWNFPFWQVFRASIPTIMAGNSFVLKHSPNVMGCAIAIEELFLEAGFPSNIFTNLIIDIDKSDAVIESPYVQGVTLTGSRRAGSAVAAVAGRCLKKTVMELGGSDPYIVLKDAKVNEACKTGMCSRMLNSGQVCISAKRFIVEEEIFDDFVNEQISLLDYLKTGDPLSGKTDIGPMARLDLLETIEQQVDRSIMMGAKLMTGGKIIDDKFYAPTLLTNVKKGMPVYDEETFGPVSVVIPAKDPEDAIRIANDSIYGLGASIWTQDMDKANHIANNIEAGAVFINGMTKSDPRLPFGGIKQSGYGRELAALGIKEFVNAKTIWLR
ncbi:MAG: NAD-dependent succinate-semialdehyde dehydrogenase [Chlorobi bacterium]|nr:NAD-dependent succinate-semialdehyde dehydrogenase [Chlorobiota bacterium]